MVPLEFRLNITLSVGVEGDVMTKAGDLITGEAFGGEKKWIIISLIKCNTISKYFY